MRFREFLKLQEAGTSTGDIAGFSRICIPMIRRQWATHWTDWHGKRKGYKQPQVQEVNWLNNQVPNKAGYAKAIGSAALKAGVGMIPFVGAFAEVGEAALKIFQMRQSGKDVTNMITQMMNAKDQAPGMPANMFDLDDNLAATISDPAKKEIAKQIMGKLDGWIKQVQSGQMPQEDANHLAVQYVQQQIQKAQTARTAPQQPAPSAPQGQPPVPQVGQQPAQTMRKGMWKY